MKVLITVLIALTLTGCDESRSAPETGYVSTTASAPNPYGLKEAGK